jgi:hypothetical protein
MRSYFHDKACGTIAELDEREAGHKRKDNFSNIKIKEVLKHAR